MIRKQHEYLNDWISRSNRKPLIIRGARQVGKTYLVRQFAELHFQYFIEINFDETPEKIDLFQSSDIKKVLDFISIDSGVPIVPGKTLLFLDEIQRAPELLARLRYFYEKYNQLHIIAAGSLLDFALENYAYSMPVGRIEYLFMGPMDFCEFLEACGQKKLLALLQSWSFPEQLPIPIHNKLLEFQRFYIAIGGMPACVREYSQNNSLLQAELEQSSIFQTFQEDFSKYKKRVHADRLKMTLSKLPNFVGRKLKYVDISREERAKDLSQAINMLQMARLVYCVQHSSGNALPLRSEKKEKIFKPLFLDIGLMMRSLNIKITNLLDNNLMLANRGAVAEQFIGQQWLYRGINYQEPELYYWNREKRGSSAEVDYLFEIGPIVVPAEVKAGTTGTLKSLQVFAQQKKSILALRFNLDRPSIHTMEAKIIREKPHRFRLVSLPLYMVSQAERLCMNLLG